jgi:trans-aconitate methyltransferase
MPETARQHWSARRYAQTARFVPALGAAVLELLDPRPGERILDLGCGDGALTEKIVAAGAKVVAVNAAPDMVAAARAKGIDARIMAGQSLAFDREFDAVFSNAALHWMQPPETVLEGIGRALKPGGRLVGEHGWPEQYRRDPRSDCCGVGAPRHRCVSPQPLVLPFRRGLPSETRNGRLHSD